MARAYDALKAPRCFFLAASGEAIAIPCLCCVSVSMRPARPLPSVAGKSFFSGACCSGCAKHTLEPLCAAHKALLPEAFSGCDSQIQPSSRSGAAKCCVASVLCSSKTHRHTLSQWRARCRAASRSLAMPPPAKRARPGRRAPPSRAPPSPRRATVEPWSGRPTQSRQSCLPPLLRW